MRIQHLIDGRPVFGRDYFETVNPATQEVLAEVARGGAAEVQRRSPRPRRRSRSGPARPRSSGPA
jgi:5-carboxymethyl-2-hydroxymuconic-semialdehyde dehydrogenase